MDLLPQVSAEDLDERDLQRGDLAMHEDPGQVQLHLKAHVHLTREREGETETLVLKTQLRRQKPLLLASRSHVYQSHSRWLG